MSSRLRRDIGERHVIADRRVWLMRGLVAELAERGLKVDCRSMWEFVHAEKLGFKRAWWPASVTIRRCPGDEPSRSDKSGVPMMVLPASRR